MNDGGFVYKGQSVPLKRAIYFFAGGTASKMEEFSERSKNDAFRAAKGPDFLSRLRGYIDIEGVNAESKQEVRRAVILKKELEQHATRVNKKFKIRKEFIKSLLQVGRYKHGARSIGAVIEMSREPDQANALRAD
jgi:translation elongation factor EF-Ts